MRTFPEPKTDIFEAFGVYRKELCGFWCNSCFSLVSLGLSGMMSFGLISTVHPLLCCRDTHGRRIPFSIVTLSLQVGEGATEVSSWGGDLALMGTLLLLSQLHPSSSSPCFWWGILSPCAQAGSVCH